MCMAMCTHMCIDKCICMGKGECADVYGRAGSFDELFAPCGMLQFIELASFRALEADGECITFWGQSELLEVLLCMRMRAYARGWIADLPGVRC